MDERPRHDLKDYDPLGATETVEPSTTSVRCRLDSTTVEVTALAPDLFRVGMFPHGRPVSYDSEAIAKSEWDPIDVEITNDESSVRLSTGSVAARIRLDPLRIGFEDASGRSFAEDDPALGMGAFPRTSGDYPIAEFLGGPVRVYKRHERGERYFGCGERTGGLEKTGSHQVFWNIDPPVGHNASLINLYTSIPFLLTLKDGKAWGLYLDNTSRVDFNLAQENPDCSWFGAENGDLIYYVFVGPSPRAVLDRYTELTGRTPMPPLWSLGNQQSRYSYMNAEEVREVAREFRQRDIPCDVLYLDIHYMDGYRVFTWDRERFPDPTGLISELREQGFHVVTIIDPGVKVDEEYPVYLEGRKRNLYCKTSKGREFHNVVWPGLCAFPDFTNPATREWWGDLHRTHLEYGVAGIWCDMNEPVMQVPHQSTMPSDVVHPGGGTPRLHAQVHNLYGFLMARATREGLQRLRPDDRPLVISRSGFAGLQRHALQWTGDNSSWWEHLWMSLPQLQNLGLSGLAWVGADVGGFDGDTTAELLTRWTEVGIFQPYCRNHTAIGTRRQEPWAFGEPWESLNRAMIKLRQRLLPYLYTLFEECHRTGAPILRPLLFEYPDDETTYALDDQFLLGDALLVAPITRAGTEYRHVYLPRGDWFHLWSGEQIPGPDHILAHAPLGRPAIYVKANVPIPLWPDMQYVGERPADPLRFMIFPAEGQGGFELYEDAGNGYDYQRGNYSRRRISCDTSAHRTVVHLGERHGSFQPQRTEMVLEVRGIRNAPQTVRMNGEEVDFQYEVERETLIISLAEQAGTATVEIDLAPPA